MADLLPFKIESASGEELLYIDANAGIMYFGGRTNGLKIEAGGNLQILGTAALPAAVVDFSGVVSKATGYSLVADSEISKIHSAGSDNQDLSGLQPKETGKGLSANDLTSGLKSNYDAAYSHSQATHAPTDANNYTHPASHPASIITQDISNRFVTDTEKSTWNAKGSSNLILGDLATNAYYGDKGKTAYDHSQVAHAPSNAQKNSDITKGEIEAKLTGEISSHTHAAGAGGSPLGMIINVQALTSSPTDSQTVYFGMLPKAPTTTANISKIYIRKACTLKTAEIYCYSGTAGTNESWSLYIRKNNSADTLINTLAVNTNERVFTNDALSISLAAGDYIEIKGVQPLWATNPATTIYGGYLYFE